MDTAQIIKVNSEIHQLNMKLDQMHWKHESEVRGLKLKMEMLERRALTKVDATAAVYAVLCGLLWTIVLVAASRT